MDKIKDGIIKNIEDALYLDKFKDVDRRTLSKMDDKELAVWQSGYPVGTPQHIIAEHEWQRRLIASQIKGAYKSAAMGIIGTIAGSIVGAIITLAATAK